MAIDRGNLTLFLGMVSAGYAGIIGTSLFIAAITSLSVAIVPALITLAVYSALFIPFWFFVFLYRPSTSEKQSSIRKDDSLKTDLGFQNFKAEHSIFSKESLSNNDNRLFSVESPMCI